MTELSRRGFFKLIAGAAVVAAVPTQALSKISTLFCDGVNCDADGFEALLRGEEVIFRDPSLARHIYWDGDTLVGNVHLYAERCIVLGKEVSGKTIEGLMIKSAAEEVPLSFSGDVQGATIQRVHIVCLNRPDHAIQVNSGGGTGCIQGDGGTAGVKS